MAEMNNVYAWHSKSTQSNREDNVYVILTIETLRLQENCVRHDIRAQQKKKNYSCHRGRKGSWECFKEKVVFELDFRGYGRVHMAEKEYH